MFVEEKKEDVTFRETGTAYETKDDSLVAEYEAELERLKVQVEKDMGDHRKNTQNRQEPDPTGENLETPLLQESDQNFLQRTYGIEEYLQPDALYLLDEPEVSLSPANQVLLAEEINKLARLLQCQFIIATHSPFMLGTLHAKIYNLDTKDYEVSKWSDLDNVRYFYDFFKKHENEFTQLFSYTIYTAACKYTEVRQEMYFNGTKHLERWNNRPYGR